MAEFKCYKCKYRGDIPGNTHSCCNFPGNNTNLFAIFEPENILNAIKLRIQADPHGVRNGWFMWPMNFDPVWLRNCDGFELMEEPSDG